MAVVADPLEVMLVGWGAWHQRHRRPEEDRDYIPPGEATHTHTIARAREFASRRKRKLSRISKLAKLRGGRDLRRLTGQQAWATDPIRCVETRTYRIETPHDIPAHVKRIDAAVALLQAWNSELADVLRREYQYDGTQEAKAGREGMPLRRYRKALELSRVWMRGHLGVA
jgi:hypothetical protein